MERREEELVGLRDRIEEQRHKLRDTELEIAEADVPKVPAKVYTPSPQEYKRRFATHLPYWNCCQICVQAQKCNPAHKASNDRANKHQSVIAIDYMYMNEMTDDTNNPILVIHDSCSGGV